MLAIDSIPQGMVNLSCSLCRVLAALIPSICINQVWPFPYELMSVDPGEGSIALGLPDLTIDLHVHLYQIVTLRYTLPHAAVVFS